MKFWLVKIKINGRNVAPGEKILLSSQITLQVGNGANPNDSIDNPESNVTIVDDGGETLTDPSLI